MPPPAEQSTHVINHGIETRLRLAVYLSVLIWSTGCATAQSADVAASDNDVLEPMNRHMYRINDFLDQTVAEPIADVYLEYMPKPIRNSISNFLDNVAYPNVILNDFLQGKGKQGLEDSGRFVVNSTFGLFGIWDMATHLGLEAHDEDFGQTLGVWGLDDTTYLVLPLIGPNSVRDAPGLGVSTLTNLLFYVSNPVAIPITVLGLVDRRARVADAVNFRDEAAVEPYLFTREAYLQRRKFLIHDGNPPVENDEFLDEIFDDLETTSAPSPQEEPAGLPVSDERESPPAGHAYATLPSEPASLPSSLHTVPR